MRRALQQRRGSHVPTAVISTLRCLAFRAGCSVRPDAAQTRLTLRGFMHRPGLSCFPLAPARGNTWRSPGVSVAQPASPPVSEQPRSPRPRHVSVRPSCSCRRLYLRQDVVQALTVHPYPGHLAFARLSTLRRVDGLAIPTGPSTHQLLVNPHLNMTSLFLVTEMLGAIDRDGSKSFV